MFLFVLEFEFQTIVIILILNRSHMMMSVVSADELLEQADYLYSCAETEKLYQLMLQYKDRWERAEQVVLCSPSYLWPRECLSSSIFMFWFFPHKAQQGATVVTGIFSHSWWPELKNLFPRGVVLEYFSMEFTIYFNYHHFENQSIIITFVMIWIALLPSGGGLYIWNMCLFKTAEHNNKSIYIFRQHPHIGYRGQSHDWAVNYFFPQGHQCLKCGHMHTVLYVS